MCADVGMKMMGACLQSDSGRQQNKARSAKLSKRFHLGFCQELENIRTIRLIRVQKNIRVIRVICVRLTFLCEKIATIYHVLP